MNYQNIPRGLDVVKRAFIPKLGALSYFDFKQIEPRLLAYFLAQVGDTRLAEKLQEGLDPYTAIVAHLYGKEPDELTDSERQTGKILFLSLMYGGGGRTVMKQFDVSYPEAKRMIKQFHDAWPGVRRLQDLCAQRAQQRGYIKTPWGRHLHPEEFGEHKLLNKLIQGSAADLMKAALLEVDRGIRAVGANQLHVYLPDGSHRPLESQMVSVVHDEIQFDGPVSEVPILHAFIPRYMCEVDPITAEIGQVIPILVDHDVSTTTWADKRPYEEVLSAISQ